MRYAKPSKLSFAVENSTFIEVYIRFSHSVLNFLISIFFAIPVICTDNLKILNEYAQKAISGCPHFAA